MIKPLSEVRPLLIDERNTNKLNLGCGKVLYEDFDNIDKIAYPGVLYIDLFKNNWWLNLQNNHYKFIYSNHFFEHIVSTSDFIHLMQGIFEVAKDGCILEIRVPYPRLKTLKGLDHHRLIDVDTFKRFMDYGTNSLTAYNYNFKGKLSLVKRISKGYTPFNLKPWALHLIFIIGKV